MKKNILLVSILAMAIPACEKHGREGPITNGSCTEGRKSSLPCGQKETIAPSDIQITQKCQSNKCETLNIGKPIFILNDVKSKKTLLSLGCREDLVHIENGSWDLSVKGIKYPHPISFHPSKDMTYATCGMFEVEQDEAQKICKFLGRNRIGENGCLRPCDETTYEFCSTEDPFSIELKGAKKLSNYPSIESY